MRPNTLVSAAPIEKISRIWIKLVSAVGFSNGCAELALKKPPPLVPSILITSWEATGPCAMSCLPPSSVVTSVYADRFCGTPCHTMTRPTTMQIGSSRYNTQRVRSTQKLPTLFADRRENPRISASASAMPVAALRKLCTVSPAICTR